MRFLIGFLVVAIVGALFAVREALPRRAHDSERTDELSIMYAGCRATCGGEVSSFAVEGEKVSCSCQFSKDEQLRSQELSWRIQHEIRTTVNEECIRENRK